MNEMKKIKDALETISGIECMNTDAQGNYCLGGLACEEFKEEFDTLECMIIDYDISKSYFGEVLHDKEEENKLLKKALLIACYDLGYAKSCYDDEEPMDEEEAQSMSIYNQYTRPKEYARRMIKKARTDRYDRQFNITINHWESEILNHE